MANPEEAVRSKELGNFLRMHRERIQEVAVGGRRRTPGLRREEVAALCRVSTTWITWLEQGRQVNASPAVLGRLAHSLRLTAAERAYMFNLAGRRDPEEVDTGAADDSVLRCVHVIDCAAYIMDQRWDVVSANARAADLFSNGAKRPTAVDRIFLGSCSFARMRGPWSTTGRRGPGDS
jgi:transcriptional regulator with XRE-family HTH domain